MHRTSFGTLDYSVIAVYLISVIVLGIVFSRRQKSLREYYQASGNVPWWAAAASMLATELSTISYLAAPGWIFLKDSRYCTGILFQLVLVPLAAAIWIPLWSRLKVISIYEYLEARFHASLRAIGAAFFIVNQTIWAGTALVVTALALERVTGFDGRWCLVIVAGVGTVYTMIGGLRAVIWTDVAQAVVFVVGYAAVLIVLLYLFDWQPMQIYEIASTTISTETNYPHTQLFSFELDLAVEASFWIVLLNSVRTIVEFGTIQAVVQRLHATRSRAEMWKSIIGKYVFNLMFTFLFIAVAWGLVAVYAQRPEMKAGITHPDQVIPDFMLRFLPTVLRSLIMAGLLAALMSSLDSAINSMGSVTITDFYRRYIAPNASERHLMAVAKLLTLFFGIILLLFALWQFDRQGDTALEKLGKLLALLMAPMLSFFLLGISSKRTNTPGVLIGAAAAIVFSVAFNGIPGLLDPPIELMNWMWVAVTATVVNLAVGYVASFLFPPPAADSLTDLTVLDG